MNILKVIQDYFISQSKEYKNYINEMTKTPIDQWYQDGERVFTKKEKEYERIYEKNKKQTKVRKEPLEVDKIKIVPATEEQQKQYLKYIEALNWSDSPLEYFPIFSKEQLNSVPDIIEGFDLTPHHKGLLLLNDLDISNSIHWIKYKIDNNNNLNSTYFSNVNYDEEKGKKIITKKDVQFNKEENDKNNLIADTAEYKIAVSALSLEYSDILKKMENDGGKQILSDFQDKVILSWKLIQEAFEKKGKPDFDISIDSFYKDVISDRFNVLKAQENIAPKIDVYNVTKEGHVSFETVKKPLEIGDKINLLTKLGDLYTKGEIKNINKGEIELNTTKGIVRAPFDARIEPLFLSDSQNKKIHIEYGVNETITLLDQRKLGMHENYFANRMDDFTNLLKGNKTSILPFEKGNEKEEGKLQIIKNFEGKPVVSLELKKPKLNIDAAYIQYGTDHFKLNQEQKEQLKKTGELGLVNLTSNVTNKQSKFWVSVDKELNTIVTQKSEAISINKIFGASTTEEQKNKLKSGEGVLLDIKGKNYFIIASAASKNSDGLRIFHETKARELNLIPSKKLDQSDIKKTGIKI